MTSESAVLEELQALSRKNAHHCSPLLQTTGSACSRRRSHSSDHAHSSQIAELPSYASRRPSDSVNTVASGLRELNKRVAERKGPKIVVKIMWDRGAIPQLWQ